MPINVVVLLVLINALCVLEVYASTAELSANETCHRRSINRANNYASHNEMWGVTAKTQNYQKYRQCMSQITMLDSTSVAVSYNWDFVLGVDGGVKSYPHLTYGWDWDGIYTTSKLPLRVGEINKLLMSYSYDIKSKGKLNLAFDIWMSKEKFPKRETLTKEIMIWVENKGMLVRRKKADTAKIDGKWYDIYIGPANPDVGKWTYIAFVAHKSSQSANLNLAQFLKYLKNNGTVSDDEYVNGISFGPEIVDGSGALTIKRFSVNTFKDE